MAYIVKFDSPDVIIDWMKAIDEKSKAHGFVFEIKGAGSSVQLRKVRMRRSSTTRPCYLSKEQWVLFHRLVNEALDQARALADVWSTPFDVKGRYWIRKGHRWEVPRMVAHE